MKFENIAGVQFRKAGKIYDFAVGEQSPRVGEYVVVDTDRGPSLAQVVRIRFLDKGELKDRKLKTIVRVANERELSRPPKLTPDEVSRFAKEKVVKLKLKMEILKSEVQFGGNRVIIYFTAPGRVDFRDLVKELAVGLKARVELKQIGARDETKILGGVGICGRELCCSSFLREFVPVSIKMAKNQNLALNPSKVSGQCGRLLCCLTYENDTYSKLRKSLPPRGATVTLLEENISGEVIRGDLLNQMVEVEDENGQLHRVKVSDIKILSSKRNVSHEAESESWGEDIDLDELT